MLSYRRLVPLICAAILVGCHAGERESSTSSSTAVRQQGHVESSSPRGLRRPSERPMANRREAQALLDSASGRLSAGETAGAAALLNRAAAFYLVQASSPPSGGTAGLLIAAESLDVIASRLRHGAAVSPEELRMLSARANLAEAERHGALASVAWCTRSKASAGDQLLMAADHVERAATDGGITTPYRMHRLLAEMRGLAAALQVEPGVDVQALDEPMADLHMQVGVMRARLDSAASWRAIPAAIRLKRSR